MDRTILIIEDNPEVRDNIREILELSNYKVLTAIDGKQGLEVARESKPDLIFCDIMMPELDGYAVLRALENNPELNSIPFIFLTAKSDKDDFRKGMDLGADDYLAKPFVGDELLRVVSARIKKHELMRKNYDRSGKGINDFIQQAKSVKELINLSGEPITKKIRKRESLFMEGDYPNFLYFINKGKLKTYKTNSAGKEFITEIYKEGDFLGYSALLEEGTHKESAVALEDTDVILITKKDFQELLYTYSDVSIAFIKLITNNLAEAERKLIGMAYDSARKKVAEAILFTYKKYTNIAKEPIKEIPIYRDDISAIAGISPESVSRNLTDLRGEGLIETNNGKLIIKDIKKLESLKW